MKKNKKLFVTDKEMTRFNITLDEGVNFVLRCIQSSKGGEIFVPKSYSYKILDVAKAVSSDSKIVFIGIRPGEKIHEELITKNDSPNTLEFKNYFIIFSDNKNKIYKYYLKNLNGKKLPLDYSYNSQYNKFLKISDLKKLIKNTIS